MKKKYIFISILLLQASTSFGQVAAIKKELSELFFNIPLSANKFEIRTAFHSNNNFFDVWNYDEINHAMSASFKDNFKLSFLSHTYCTLVFWFDEGKENTNSRKITVKYSEEELSKCISQFQEIISFFKDKSYKANESTVINGKKEQSGVGMFFYASAQRFAKFEPYLDMNYRYMDNSEFNKKYPSSAQKNYYELEIILKDNYILK